MGNMRLVAVAAILVIAGRIVDSIKRKRDEAVSESN
jgi:hypothetical protein